MFPHPEPCATGAGPKEDEADVRPRFEANVSRAFQLLALSWLDGLLAQYSKLIANCSWNRITLQALSPQGFAVTLLTEGGRCKVLLGPCGEEFGSVAEATAYMTSAICGDLRLRVDLESRPHKWTVERRFPDGSWLEEGACGTLRGSDGIPFGNSWYFCNRPEPESWPCVSAPETHVRSCPAPAS